MSTNIARHDGNHKIHMLQKIHLVVKNTRIQKPKSMKNILVTIDFEKEANLLVEKAGELATKFGSKVWLLHVAAPDPDFVGYAPGPQNEIDFRLDELKNEFRIIALYTHQLKLAGIEAEGLLVKGQTVETILEKIAALHI